MIRLMQRFLLCILLFWSVNVVAQPGRNLSGTVYGNDDKGRKEYLEGAVVFFPNTPTGTQTEKDGKFSLIIPDSSKILVITYVGYIPDTITLAPEVHDLDIVMQREHKLKEVVIHEKVKTTEVGLTGLIKMETIGQQELYKAACCNLSESFETTPSVDVSFTDAVSGNKQIKLLGLASSYTLITQENIPDMRGLGAITGISLTPGSWIESMQLSKGTGSVVNGYESVAGQINVELKKPFDGEKWFFNLYQSSQGRSEADVNYRHKITSRLGFNVMANISSQWLKVDLNRDHFIDQPVGNKYNVLNRWIYNAPGGWMFQAGIKFSYSNAMGGEWNYKAGEPQVPGNPWGFQSTIARVEDWAKIAKVFSRPATSIGLQLSNIDFSQDATYGPREYIAVQNSYYANLIFQTYINNTNHLVKFGASDILDVMNEQFDKVVYNRRQNTPGIFGEYTWNYSDKFNVIAGLRADDDNIYGGFLTPRLHVRYAPFKRTTIRASVGRAQRTANIFSENIGFMAGNRQFVIPQPGKAYGLNPEVAWNTGFNITHKFKNGFHEGVITLDYYYTNFQNQVVVDIDYPGIVSFYDLAGKSFAHSLSMQLDYELVHNLNVRLAYRYYYVMCTYEGVLLERPLVPANRAFVNVDYQTRNKNKWKFDYTIQYIGTERTPGITHNHAGLSKGGANYSPSFLQMNAQVTKVFSDKFELYLGGENLTNYMQHDAIVNVSDPYSKSFDASMIWGPMMGINIYTGLRYKIK